MDVVLMKGPYFFRNIPLMLKEWGPDFNFKRDMLHTLPLWITLPQLPLHLWGANSLSKIGSAIGVPLVTNECTANKLRISYARILVEIDITKELTKEVAIKDCEGRKLMQKAKPPDPVVLVTEEKKQETVNEESDGVWTQVTTTRDRGKQILTENTPSINCENGFEALEALNDLIVTLDRGPCIVILIETRVKSDKARSIRNKLKLYEKYIDNYQYHSNGRIWITWDEGTVDIKELEKRKKLWKYFLILNPNQTNPWCAIGDYNNVAQAQDRIGGRLVLEHEYKDMQDMMHKADLSEMDSLGGIDRMLCNTTWLKEYMDLTLTHLSPGVSDHALLHVIPKVAKKRYSKRFQFFNCITDIAGYEEAVRESWNKPIKGSPMFVLWNKLQRLKPVLTNLSKPLAGLKNQLIPARLNLEQAHLDLNNHRSSSSCIARVKECT
ncbi:uncharacterized protein LOC131614990 [Vicia villosa]|uniref:uncharacterized protein LOC131614990 n=1 Tax=Vicia villosa TaxID=3911 RepID=UPI00273C47D0|nr:uncharacterized protein LOC131614990 [Vicia villosa]